MNTSNSSLKEDTLREQFVYPKNRALKEAYIALLGQMKLHRKIRFTVYECASAIVEHNGWVLDYNPGGVRKPGPNYLKAIQYMKVLENPFFRFHGVISIELCVYDAVTKRRVTDFDTFFKMCAEDVYMSAYSSCDVDVIFEEWSDRTSLEDHSQIDSDLAEQIHRMDSAVQLKEDILESSFESIPNNQDNSSEHRGESTMSEP